MCGICGFSSADKTVDRPVFEAAIDLVKHRGPDGRGSFYEGGLALGHRRLAIIDLSDDGAQPFHYSDKYVAVYNGEIYNYVELKNELETQGYTFATTSDTEVLLAAYDAFGPDCVQRFNGMWAFCIYDKARNILFCSRDRFGIKPFYYCLEQGSFAFGSEIKQLLHLRGGTARANREMLAHFLVLGEMDHTEATLYQDIRQLCAGHNLVFSLDSRSIALTRWFELPDEPEAFTGSYEQACAAFRRDFSDAIALRMRADVPLGSCLSGGLDSSAIVGEMHRQLKQHDSSGLQHTVSSCYDEKAFNEQEYIDAVLQLTGAASHKVFPKLDGRPEEWLDRLIWHADEPLSSSSGYSQWCVFEEARRQKLTVMLDGQGADEQLAGYAQFHMVYFVELLRQRRFKLFGRELKAYKRLRAQYQPVSTLAVAAFCMMTALLPKGLMRAVNSLFIRMRKPRIYSHPLWKKLLLGSPQYTMPSTRRYISENLNGHLRLLLHMEDRNSMAHSVEARVPFLDPALAATTYGLPFGYKIRDGISKAVLRDATRDILPEKVYARQNKMGFPAPEATLMRNNAEWFKNELSEACERFSFMVDERDAMQGFEAYLAHPQNSEFVWWRLICANRWAKLFKVEV